jgi:hypothetical protein
MGAVILLLISLGFYSNIWRVAEPGWFLAHEKGSEAHVVGRMVKSRQEGIFSAAGLMGVGLRKRPWEAASPTSIELQEDQSQFPRGTVVEFQYQAYADGLPIDTYSVYLSQVGGQGILFSVFDRLSPLSPGETLEFFYLLTSVLSALALTLVILWFGGEFGWFVAMLLVVSTVASQWLVVFGRNLWWSMWAFYLPMVSVLLYLRFRKVSEIRWAGFGTLVFLAVLIKCLANGYEYMTTTLVMMVVPMVYYGALDGWGRRRFFQGTSAAVLGSGLAIAVSLAILLTQIASVKGGIADGLSHLAFSFGSRTHGAAENFPASYAQNLEAGTLGVLMVYLKGVFFDLNNFLETGNPLVRRFLFSIRFLYLIVLFFFMSLIVFLRRNASLRSEEWKRQSALLWATWFSILAPLSWFIMFKAHSHEHPHMNHVVWQMPFTLFGFAVCGLAIRGIVSELSRTPR